MNVPTPKEVARQIELIRNQMLRIYTAHRWLHDIAYTRDRRGELIRDESDEKGGGKVAAGRPPRGGDPADPTGDLVTARDKQAARRALIRASKAVESAFAELKSAEYTLKNALVDHNDPAPAVVGRALVTRNELQEAREAKDRRLERGEGFGDS